MNKIKSLRELKSLVEADIKYNKDFVDSINDDKNPQVVAMVNDAKSRVEAMKAVLLYISTGENFLFEKNV